MGEEGLSDVMQSLTNGDIQVLVCTTIIETGIDIPNVNTLIIEDADRLGLAQLHQIRGRIGRSARRAYAYMTYRPGKILTEVAAKRLTAIREYAEFGSGFRIAMRDLEIRGAGNLLGPEQSGYMMSVGYDMYLQLLEDAVLEEQGGKRPVVTECAADLTVSANIPDRYVPSAEQRMDLYRRIAAIRSQEDAADLIDEMIDRYGDPPKSVHTLLDVALLRAAAAKAGISDIAQRGDKLRFLIADFAVEAIAKVCAMPKYRQRLNLAAGDMARDAVRNAVLAVERLGLSLGERDAAFNIEGGGNVDGPSMGLAAALVLLSALQERPLRQDVAVTGEIALDGAVLPVGGLLQKRVAAREAGFRRILQPRDGGYLPRDCVGVSTLQEAEEAAFADG